MHYVLTVTVNDSGAVKRGTLSSACYSLVLLAEMGGRTAAIKEAKSLMVERGHGNEGGKESQKSSSWFNVLCKCRRGRS